MIRFSLRRDSEVALGSPKVVAVGDAKTPKRVPVRACTGFDGGFEVREAIRRLLDCVPTGN